MKPWLRIATNLQNKGIGVVAISSNDVEDYPQDGPEQMQKHAEKLKLSLSLSYTMKHNP